MSNEVERKKMQSAQNKMLPKNMEERTKYPTVHYVQGLVACQK